MPIETDDDHAPLEDMLNDDESSIEGGKGDEEMGELEEKDQMPLGYK